MWKHGSKELILKVFSCEIQPAFEIRLSLSTLNQPNVAKSGKAAKESCWCRTIISQSFSLVCQGMPGLVFVVCCGPHYSLGLCSGWSPWTGCPFICVASMGKGRTHQCWQQGLDRRNQIRCLRFCKGEVGKVYQEVEANQSRQRWMLVQSWGRAWVWQQTQHEPSADVSALGRHRQCPLALVCAREADACGVRSKLLWFPNAHI